MGVKLEWQIDSDKNRGNQQHNEDPLMRRKRWRIVLRLLLLIGVLLLIIAGGVWLVSQRLNQVDMRQKQLLENTVSAEVASIRVGEKGTYMDLQRSATNDWIQLQEQTYNAYQTLKSTSDINLTGRVINSVISGQRGRVQVEEIENGIPYTRTWFYWNYDEITNDKGEVVETGGWHHVPPDYTFWGDSQTINGQRMTIRFQAVDQNFGSALNTKLTEWFNSACGFVDCANVPYLTVDIVATPLNSPRWADGDMWQMIIPSPYLDRARADMPFDTAIQIEVATMLSTRLIDHASVTTNTIFDASFLQNGVVSWLVGKWVQLDTQAYLIDSMARNYGDATVGQLLKSLQATSDIGVLSSVLGVIDLSKTSLDWRDFLNWRLQLENTALTNRDQDTYLRLYDTRNDSVRQSAYDRFNANLVGVTQQVTMVTAQTSPDGTAQLVATLTDGQQVIFNLVNNNWQRAS